MERQFWLQEGVWDGDQERASLIQSLLSCQVSLPIREHWFSVTYSTVCACKFAFDRSVSNNGPAFGGYDHIRKPVQLLICVDAKQSPLFKWIHGCVAKCWFHTLMFNENYQAVLLSATQQSHHNLILGKRSNG